MEKVNVVEATLFLDFLPSKETCKVFENWARIMHFSSKTRIDKKREAIILEMWPEEAYTGDRRRLVAVALLGLMHWRIEFPEDIEVVIRQGNWVQELRILDYRTLDLYAQAVDFDWYPGELVK